MAYTPIAYRTISAAPTKGFWRNRYFRIVLTIFIITLVSSFYVYQRVWVRRLVKENEQIAKQTENARLYLARLPFYLIWPCGSSELWKPYAADH